MSSQMTFIGVGCSLRLVGVAVRLVGWVAVLYHFYPFVAVSWEEVNDGAFDHGVAAGLLAH